MDQFRLINDTCGHNVGDALLQWISALLREVTSESDVLSRLGGDEFGTGMASYGYLKGLPVDFLKIDGIFIKDMVSNKFNRTIVDSINQIGHFLGISTIAEFVGSQNVFNELRNIGVDFAQGYWTGKPMPLSELFKPNSVPPLPLQSTEGSAD